jgi:hypothetical protein
MRAAKINGLSISKPSGSNMEQIAPSNQPLDAEKSGVSKRRIVAQSIVACVLFLAFTTAHALEATEICTGPSPSAWELLSAPPPESEQMLAITLKAGPMQSAGKLAQEAWFQSKSGSFRFCRYQTPTDRCFAIADYFDFQLRGGRWYVATAGRTSNCPHPRKCWQSLNKDSATRTEGDHADNAVARPIALRSIAERLSEAWPPPSTDVYMAISSRQQAQQNMLHFCIENTSMHPLDVNDSALPWNAPNLFRLTVLNASGTVVFSSGFFSQLTTPPLSHTINVSDSIEGDLELSRFPFYEGKRVARTHGLGSRASVMMSSS